MVGTVPPIDEVGYHGNLEVATTLSNTVQTNIRSNLREHVLTTSQIKFEQATLNTDNIPDHVHLIPLLKFDPMQDSLSRDGVQVFVLSAVHLEGKLEEVSQVAEKLHP